MVTTSLMVFTTINQAAGNDYQQILKNMTGQNLTVKSVKDAAVSGFKEVVVSGGSTHQIIYLSNDGEYLFDGNLIRTQAKENLTELAENSMRMEMLDEFKKAHKSIDFFPAAMTDHITVFTDIDCGYCRKLHEDVSQYNDLGIGVSYLFFPRTGLNTASHTKAINVWCADDQQTAMTQAKSGQSLSPMMCPNPIETQFNLGLGMGVHKVGTPAVLFADGSLLPGYLPAQAMKSHLEEKSKHSQSNRD
ncbi:thioredoxin fold domain-containing protein [Marinicella marina]|nr:thioredoxin fold domain-containing protein [Marinicella marina]